MLGIPAYLWRLIPANPILLRVVATAGKRKRDLAIRAIYLGLLILLVVAAIITRSGGVGTAVSLTALNNISVDIFQRLSYLQLALVALLAPVFTAGAITQEKDSQTYDILLATPLTNGQIVLGSLLSRLFFVLALLISGIPIFSITQIFGGVSIGSIFTSCMVAAATAMVTGSLAMAIATFKVGTRRTIFSFYLFIVVYLVGLFLLDSFEIFHLPVAKDAATGAVIYSPTGWLTGLHPFLALRTAFGDLDYQPLSMAQIPDNLRYWPVSWYLTSPASFYVTAMVTLSVVLVLPSIVMLRWMAQTTLSPKQWLLTKLRLGKGDRTRKPRSVWHNPIAWREARTKASAARAVFLRYGFMLAGIAGALTLAVLVNQDLPVSSMIRPGAYDATTAELTVIDEGIGKRLRVSPRSAFTIGNRSLDVSQLPSRTMEVLSLTTRADRQGRAELTDMALGEVPRRLSIDTARDLLLGLVIIEFAVILLIVTNAAASTVTREKEDGSLDLLLTTPITSRYYIWGKLRGLVAFVLPLVAVPVVSVLLFVLGDIYRALSGEPGEWLVFPEAMLILPPTIIIWAAFAAILGMNISLRFRSTVKSVMSSVGIVVGVCALFGWCGFQLISSNASAATLSLGAFSPFTVVTVLVKPMAAASRVFSEPDQIAGARVTLFVFALVATGVYTAIVWSMYRTMVRNFDMTIRKQAR